MVKRIMFILACTSLTVTSSSQKSITTQFPLKWKVKIGVTTYRTNIIEDKGSVLIGSNGTSATADIDELDGVHQIDARTGKIENQFLAQILGDNDVTGIALSGNKLFFGTDNYYFYCFNVDSNQELWKYRTPYDVESAPVIADLNGDGKEEVVFNVQGNGLYCLDADTGAEIWVLDSISSHQGNSSPLVIDCNDDGVLDVVSSFRGMPNSSKTAGFKMAHYGDYLLAVNGNNGTPIWYKATGAGIHASPFYFEENGVQLIVSLDSYGELQVLNLKGELEKDMGFGYSKYMSPIMYQGTLILSDYAMDFGYDKFQIDDKGYNRYIGGDSDEFNVDLKGRVSATALVADVRGNGKMQFVSVSESGELGIVNEDGSKIEKFSFPEGAEATPLIKDIDGDGMLEVVIASLDGYLYCYETNSSGKVFYGQFRRSNSNRVTKH